MFIALAAVLSLAASVAIDVPYLPQTDALCGGAAVAMVLRYWGDARADAQAFAPLIDRRAGGIGNDVLTSAVSARGWPVERVGDSLDDLATRVHDGFPVIVLLPDRGPLYHSVLYHYVVVIGVSADAVVVHDPAWGPSRTIRAPDFERAWRSAHFWSLLILPSPHSAQPAAPEITNEPDRVVADVCDAKLNRALDEIRVRGLDQADALLGEVRAECPVSAGPLRELSAVRFAQQRWSEAAALARDALRRDPRDTYALDVLGSSLFMLNDDVGALRAWNQIDKPHVNRVRIDGLHHTRYQTVADAMAIQPNMLLTAEIYERARRRLSELPDRATTRLAVRPEADGFATVDVVVVEIAAVPRGLVEWGGAVASALTNREIDVAVPGVSGQGEVWSAGWRWWHNRPGVSVGFAAPHARGLPGVWRFDGSWQSDTYGSVDGARLVQSRTHGGLTVSDWLSGRVRYSVTTGVDAWGDARRAVSLGGTLERVAFNDRLSLSVDATQWAPIAGGSAFRAVGARASARSSLATQGWVTRGTIGVQRVSDTAPLALWPGAGEGQVRVPLLRAHPLLDDGVVDLTAGSAFGRTLTFASGEAQRWLERPVLVRLGLAGFVDLARASRQLTGDGPQQVDVGGGLRIKIPGIPGVLRGDLAHGLRDGANALTFGWLY